MNRSKIDRVAFFDRVAFLIDEISEVKIKRDDIELLRDRQENDSTEGLKDLVMNVLISQELPWYVYEINEVTTKKKSYFSIVLKEIDTE